MKAIKLIPKYLWQYRAIIALLCVFTSIFALISYLYELPLDALLYTILLCLVVGGLFTAIHFYRFCKKHYYYEVLAKHAQTLELPPPKNMAEIDLYAVICKLREQYRADLELKRYERAEYLDYYTMWMHQIKTPISAMSLMLQNDDTKENRALGSELFRIEQYVEMALWYLRMDDMNDMVFKPYALDGIIKDAVRKYAPLFVSKKIQLKYTPIDVEVITDKKWLTFIIEQLLSNAIKYTEKGSVTISVDNKVLSIADTGIGIANEDISRIFEKGYTGYNGRLERKSTGIGLYLCSRASQKLSHKISVVSKVGQGSTFYVDLNTYNLQAE